MKTATSALRLASEFCIVAVWLNCLALGVEPWTPDGILAKVKISSSGMPPCASGIIADKEILFLVDTGASRTILDPVVMSGSSSAKTTRIGTGQTTFTASLQDSPGVSFAGIDCRWLDKVVVQDLSVVRLGTGADVYGVAGVDILSRFVLHIDADNGVLLLCDPRLKYDPPGTEMPMTEDRFHVPIINATIRDRVVPFMVDTGCLATGQLSRKLSTALISEGDASRVGAIVPSYDLVGAGISIERVRCSLLKLNPISKRDLVFNVTSDNILGYYFFCRFQTTFDFDRKSVSLRPSDSFALKDRQDFLGVTLASPEPNLYIINRVDSNSPASQSGFKEGDEILDIDGVAVSRISTASVMQLLGYPRKDALRFTVKRRNAIERITVDGG